MIRQSAKNLYPVVTVAWPVTKTFLYRVLDIKYSAKRPLLMNCSVFTETSLPRATLGKSFEEPFAEYSFSSVTLGKSFAEYKIAFAECSRHSAKNLCLVVTIAWPIKPIMTTFLYRVLDIKYSAKRPLLINCSVFTETSLPRATLGKSFAECYRDFAVSGNVHLEIILP
jgi:hypothetical protein